MFLWFKEKIRGPSFSTLTLGLQWVLLQRQLPEPLPPRHLATGSPVLFFFQWNCIREHSFWQLSKNVVWKSPISSFLVFLSFFFFGQSWPINLHRLQDTFTYFMIYNCMPSWHVRSEEGQHTWTQKVKQVKVETKSGNTSGDWSSPCLLLPPPDNTLVMHHKHYLFALGTEAPKNLY